MTQLNSVYAPIAVGERVRFIDRDVDYAVYYGRTGTVLKVQSGIHLVHFDPIGNETPLNVWFMRSRLTPVEKPQGEALKQQGQAKALRKAGSVWLAGALAKFKDYCAEAYISGNSSVTMDAFRATANVAEPASHNAWGALPRSAVKAGYIEPTTEVAKAQRGPAHARSVRVWRIRPSAL